MGIIWRKKKPINLATKQQNYHTYTIPLTSDDKTTPNTTQKQEINYMKYIVNGSKNQNSMRDQDL